MTQAADEGGDPLPRPTRQLGSVVGLIRGPHRTIRSLRATGGVYKRQGRDRRGLLTYAYWGSLQAPIPNTGGGWDVSEVPADTSSVALVRPRTSKGITDLLSHRLVWLSATRPSKKSVRKPTRTLRKPHARLHAVDDAAPALCPTPNITEMQRKEGKRAGANRPAPVLHVTLGARPIREQKKDGRKRTTETTATNTHGPSPP